MAKRLLPYLSIAFIVAGCAGPLAAPKPATISGHVTVRTCGGAAREDSPGCRLHPAPGMTLAFRKLDGGDISFATTDSKGFYSLELPAGAYRVEQKDPWPSSSHSGPRAVTVTAGQAVTADFSYTIQVP